MRTLFTMDLKNYKMGGEIVVRPSARGVVLGDSNNVAMVHSLKHGYYKFPGGGVEEEETIREALVREVREEVGLVVIPETIQEFGLVPRLFRGMFEDILQEDNYYYICRAEKERVSQKLDAYEDDEQFVLSWVRADEAIEANAEAVARPLKKSRQFLSMLQRENRILELLCREGYLH